MNEENMKESHAIFFLVSVQFWNTIATQMVHKKHESMYTFGSFLLKMKRGKSNFQSEQFAMDALDGNNSSETSI